MFLAKVPLEQRARPLDPLLDPSPPLKSAFLDHGGQALHRRGLPAAERQTVRSRHASVAVLAVHLLEERLVLTAVLQLRLQNGALAPLPVSLEEHDVLHLHPSGIVHVQELEHLVDFRGRRPEAVRPQALGELLQPQLPVRALLGVAFEGDEHLARPAEGAGHPVPEPLHQRALGGRQLLQRQAVGRIGAEERLGIDSDAQAPRGLAEL
mmetsp:Transcript_65362/g.200116  ORF Transcript_65362/g.200116 Transcript_65362/m.200116 type:complete len:209 (+) Transcript_65362:1177-1803(+)